MKGEVKAGIVGVRHWAILSQALWDLVLFMYKKLLISFQVTSQTITILYSSHYMH